MAINTQELFDLKAGQYSTTSQSEDFNREFFYCLIRVCNDLSGPRVGIDVSAPESLEENLDLDVDKYFGVVCDGLDAYLTSTGRWGQTDPKTAMDTYNTSIRRARTQYQIDNPPTTRY